MMLASLRYLPSWCQHCCTEGVGSSMEGERPLSEDIVSTAGSGRRRKHHEMQGDSIALSARSSQV
eukprot:2637754-Rhodomonas_salina.1